MLRKPGFAQSGFFLARWDSLLSAKRRTLPTSLGKEAIRQAPVAESLRLPPAIERTGAIIGSSGQPKQVFGPHQLLTLDRALADALGT